MTGPRLRGDDSVGSGDDRVGSEDDRVGNGDDRVGIGDDTTQSLLTLNNQMILFHPLIYQID